MRLNFFLLIIATLGGTMMPDSQSRAADAHPYRYVITETAGPSSLDPLEADNTINLPVARMIYATPLETSKSNQLTSRVLESFRYDIGHRQVEWQVKEGLKFEDGTPLTANDVAFAVARMVYTRPKFPVIEAIEGVESWLKSKEALKSFPKGLRVEGNKITIHFTRDVDHPLFRFCLELFSIIPRRCVDPLTNKISCAKIPESGPYKITEQSPAKISFSKRDHVTERSMPAQIRFEYVPAGELAKRLGEFDDSTVIAGRESSYDSTTIRELESKLSMKFTPAALISILQINQNVGVFQNKKCRQLFAKTYRTAYHEVAKDSAVEGSVFTKILPGYLPLKDLESSSALTAQDIESCKTQLAKSKFPWGYPEAEKDAIAFQALRRTFELLGLESSAPITTSTRKEFSDLFSEGKLAFSNGGTGFWALDPAGDIKMLFTPNLHKPLNHVSNDDKLQHLIAKVPQGAPDFLEVNRYLFEEARFNVYAHHRRFFASKNKDLLGEVPFAITSPAPWQVFRMN